MGAKFTGIVSRGKQLGGKLGFPTANISLDPGQTIAEGVYAAVTTVDDERYEGMANVGRKTLLFAEGHYTGGEREGARAQTGGDGRSETRAATECGQLILEVNLFDFSGDLYGKTIGVELFERIRGERKFASARELKEAVEGDRRTIEEYFKTHR